MDRNTDRRTKLALSLLGIATAIPLIAIPASANLSNGGFRIKAVDAANSSIVGFGGPLTLESGVTPEPTPEPTPDPTPEPTPDPTPEVPQDPWGPFATLNFQCGPMSLTIDKEMADFSKENEALYAAGKSAEMKTHPGGWKLITSFTPTGMKPGIPRDGTKPQIVALSSGTAGSISAPSSNRVYATTVGDRACMIQDKPVTPKAGDRFFYIAENHPDYTGTLITDARYIQEGGKLIEAWGSVTNGYTGVKRKALNSSAYPKSDSKPVRVDYVNTGDGFPNTRLIEVAFTTDRGGFDMITLKEHPNGTGRVDYQVLNATESGGTLTPRKTGPRWVEWDATGKYTRIGYVDPTTGAARTWAAVGTNNTQIVANYNAQAKQSWHGATPRSTNYDITMPFEPVR